MTEAEWHACNDRVKLFESLTVPSDRKCILFAVQCCLRRPHKYTRRVFRRLLRRCQAAEAFADGGYDVVRLRRGWGVQPPYEEPCHPERAQEWARTWVMGVAQYLEPVADEVAVSLLKDIFGDPFRTVLMNQSWLSSTVVALGQGIYEDQAFDRLPILADALQDAGCEDDRILTHLRGGGLHVKGCWALDLVLGKS